MVEDAYGLCSTAPSHSAEPRRPLKLAPHHPGAPEGTALSDIQLLGGDMETALMLVAAAVNALLVYAVIRLWQDAQAMRKTLEHIDQVGTLTSQSIAAMAASTKRTAELLEAGLFQGGEE